MSSKLNYRLREKSRFKLIDKKRKQKFARNNNYLLKQDYDYDYKYSRNHYGEDILSDKKESHKKIVAIDKKLIDEKLNSIVNILGINMLSSNRFYKDATLYNKKDFKKVINKKIRRSKKITINNKNKKYEKLNNILVSILKKQFDESQSNLI